MHSGDYRDPLIFKDKRMIMIGNKFSGNEICTDALPYASTITQIFRSPNMLIKKWYNGYPFTFWLFNLRVMLSQDLFPSEEAGIQSRKALLDIFGNPRIYHPLLEVDETTANFSDLSLAEDEYITALANGKINLIKCEATELYEDGVVLQDGTKIEGDVVILSTGYSRAYGYLSKKIQNIVKYDESTRTLPWSLYRGIFHPDLPGLCIVGNVSPPFDCRYELQAHIGIKWMLGTLDITREELIEGVSQEDHMRRTQPNNIRGYAPNSYFYELTRVLKINFDFAFIENDLHFKNPLCLTSLVFINSPEALEKAKNVIEEIYRKFPDFDSRSVK